jgi:hypothetical protein
MWHNSHQRQDPGSLFCLQSPLGILGERGHIEGPEWAWELVGWLLVLAVVVTAVRVLLEC